MNSLKKRLRLWFKANFAYSRQDKSNWIISSKSSLGCLLFLPIFVLFIGYGAFLFFKIYPLIFSVVVTRLGIAFNLNASLIIACLLGCFINLPLFVLTASNYSKQPGFELFPFWLFKRFFAPTYQTKSKSYNHIYLNVTGGLIPIGLALYQFIRVQPSAILIITALVSLMSYFSVQVIPGRRICIIQSRLYLIAMAAALSAMVIVPRVDNRFDVLVAFAGSVLGMTIGADLLHLKGVCSAKAATPLSIGGAGFNDAIFKSGLYALILAEWLPVIFTWLSTRF